MRPLRSVLRRFWFLAAVVVLAVSCGARESRAAISDCIDATCRITTPDGSRGTGCVFEISQGRVYVLTAAHVVGQSATVECEFWRQGHQSQPLAGQVVRRVENDECDAAVVALEESLFGGLLPAVVPVAPRDYVVRPNETLVSVGCAKGCWSTGWKGHALGYRGAALCFAPTPADGRSGSALFDAAGEKIVGVVRARTVDGGEGIACSLQSLYQHFRTTAAGTNTQCGPGGCPTPKPYVLPYRYREQFRDQPPPQAPQQVWPTLPAPAPTPPSTVDLSTTNEKLDQIVDLLAELKESRAATPPAAPAAPAVPAAPSVPVAPPIDDAAVKAAAEAKADAAAAKGEVEAAKQEQSKLREAVNALIGDRETLRDRFEARLAKVKEELGEDASRGEIARAYVKDLAAEKLAGGAGWTMGRLLAAALGISGPLALAIGLAGFLASRRVGGKVQEGEPLLVQRMFERLSDRIDGLKDRLHPGQPAKPTA